MLTLNQVIQFAPFEAEDGVFERILYISPEQDYIYSINLNKKTFPKYRLMTKILASLRTGEVRMVDHVTQVEKISYNALPEDRKTEMDAAWEAIEELVKDEPYIYMSEYRGRMVNACIEKTELSMPTIHRYLKRYWASGKLKIGLLNLYHNCGSLGTNKVATEQTAKRGRPRKITKVSPDKVGINSDADVLKNIRRTYRFFHQKEKLPLRKAFKKMLRTSYVSHYETAKGKLKPILLPREKRPEFKTFHYHVNKIKNENYIGNTVAFMGERRFNLHARAKIGNQTKLAQAPGSIFHIDATIADIYIASRYREFLPLGRPVIYSVIDVFSHLVVGLYIGFEGPSYIGAAMAIYNTGTSKVDFCRKIGFEIEEDAWPAQHLPSQFTADRGELLTTKNTGLRNVLGVDIEYMAPYRADWKALVESYFNVYNTDLIKRLPGHVAIEMQQRGEPDPRTKAVLTLNEFSEMLVDLVIHHNNERWLSGYQLDEHMIAEGVKPIPRELWLWGKKRRGHCLRFFEESYLKLNLLPTENGRITNRGIKFQGAHYKCDQAIEEGWFVDGNPRMGNSLKIAFDPRYAGKVILKGYHGIGYQELELVDEDHHARDKSWDEFMQIQEVIDIEHEIYKEHEDQADAELGYKIDTQVEMSLLLKQDCNMSKAQLLKEAKEWGPFEKELNRSQEHFFNTSSNITTEEPVSVIENDESVVPFPVEPQPAEETKKEFKVVNARLNALLNQLNRRANKSRR